MFLSLFWMKGTLNLVESDQSRLTLIVYVGFFHSVQGLSATTGFFCYKEMILSVLGPELSTVLSWGIIVWFE